MSTFNAGATFDGGKAERTAAKMRWRVVKAGKVLAGCKTREKAVELAAFLGAEVVP